LDRVGLNDEALEDSTVEFAFEGARVARWDGVFEGAMLFNTLKFETEAINFSILSRWEDKMG